MKVPTATAFLLLLPSLASARIGGRCDGDFNDGSCICLKKSVCEDKWQGTVVRGTKGHWPCPWDDDSVLGCNIPHCFGFFTGCKFTSQCKYLGPKNLCPGDSSFRCCFLDP